MKLHHIALILSCLGMVGQVGLAHADDTAPVDRMSVEIKLFRMAGQHTYAAELCGVVTGMVPQPTGHIQLVHVYPDYKERTAPTHVVVGADGVFCTMIFTYTGFAAVTLDGVPNLAGDMRRLVTARASR